jgi:hypothetical protein
VLILKKKVKVACQEGRCRLIVFIPKNLGALGDGGADE